MPNWCNNNIKFSGPKEDIEKFEKFLNDSNGKEWFDFFKPTPVELLENGWYEWNVTNWGTKWNADANDWEVEYDGDVGFVTFWFDSAWSPPVSLYEWIEENTSLMIVADYHEEGMCFVGRFEDGSDEYYEYSDGLEDLESIPEDIVEYWNLREMLEEREEWENEDDEENEK